MNSHLEHKSQEIAHALIRIAAYIRKPELKKRIDSYSYDLIAAIAANNSATSVNTANVLKAFVILGRNTLLIEPNNARILMRELDGFIKSCSCLLRLAEVDIASPQTDLITRLLVGVQRERLL